MVLKQRQQQGTLLLVLIAVCLLLVGQGYSISAWAVGNTQVRIRQIQQERAKLKRIRMQLEAKLGTLGRSLKKLDQALVQAGSDVRQATAAVNQADARLADLTAKQLLLQQQVDALKRNMLHEADTSWRHARTPPLWLDVMFGAQVTDIPHHQYILSRLMTTQAAHRRMLAQDLLALAQVKQQVKRQRFELTRLQRKKLTHQQQLAERQKAKRGLWNKVYRDASLKKKRDKALARQEAALKHLLQGIGSTLLASDLELNRVSMRQRKGHLPWPLKGRIVARFHSRPAQGRPRLDGIQLAPEHGHGQIKAIAAGQVRYADWFGGYGLMLIVDHGDGLMTVYAHNDTLYRHLGDWVETGDILADAGNTGWVKDIRLYFEVRDKERPVNPVRWCHK